MEEGWNGVEFAGAANCWAKDLVCSLLCCETLRATRLRLGKFDDDFIASH